MTRHKTSLNTRDVIQRLWRETSFIFYRDLLVWLSRKWEITSEMPEKRWMIYLCRVFKHCFFFQPATKLFEILVKTPVLFWSVGMIKQLSSSMPLKKGNSNRFLSYMDGRFRQQLTINDVSMSVARLIINTYFKETLLRQRRCFQVFGICDRITWKQIN